MTKIKTVVVGVGSLGQHHARILSQHENSEFIGVVDADVKRGEKIAKSCSSVNFTDVKDIIGKVQA
ncbi:MAG: Gfo/Idh/MocA family oxidoreductase, partial [Endomicrobiia bacterium]